MAEKIQFKDNSLQVKKAIDAELNAWLEEAAGEIEAQIKQTSPVDTGQLKSSWRHVVDKADKRALIGSGIENAIWNEFGTGQYALQGGGRLTPWAYKDADGQWHKTTGKRPQRTLHKAFRKMKPKLRKQLETTLKGLGK